MSSDYSTTTLENLRGKRILITRPQEQSIHAIDKLSAYGATATCVPVISINPPEDWNDVDRCIKSLDSFNWLFFASANAVRFFLNRFIDYEPIETFNNRTAVIGPGTAGALRRFGIEPTFVSHRSTAESFLDEFLQQNDVSNQKILWLRGNLGRFLIADELQTRGAAVESVTCYNNVPPEAQHETAEQLARLLLHNEVDAIVFASGQSAKNFAQLVQFALRPDYAGDTTFDTELLAPLLEHVTVASIGPETSKACIRCFGRVDVEAKVHTMDGLISVLADNP